MHIFSWKGERTLVTRIIIIVTRHIGQISHITTPFDIPNAKNRSSVNSTVAAATVATPATATVIIVIVVVVIVVMPAAVAVVL